MDKSLENKTADRNITSLSNSLILSSNNKLSFCYKKTSKLLKVIYFLTDKKINDNDLVKSLRLTARKIVKDILDIFLEREKDKKKEALIEIFFVISLIETSVIEGVFDEENASLLQEEYMKVISVLEIFSGEYKENNLFIEKLNNIKSELNVDNQDVFDLNKNPINGIRNKGEIFLDSKIKNNNLNINNIVGRNYSMSRGQSDYKRQDINVIKDNNRQEIIIDTIRKKGVVTIKDISVVLPNVSEKTVQREIISLVGRGLINKEGERRWSRYSLVSQ